jgi:hypothetical protein
MNALALLFPLNAIKCSLHLTHFRVLCITHANVNERMPPHKEGPLIHRRHCPFVADMNKQEGIFVSLFSEKSKVNKNPLPVQLECGRKEKAIPKKNRRSLSLSFEYHLVGRCF